ncbi:MAG: tRNA glutamyl-Q(34) synthetase GluQRS [Steroidobacterales bacterium]
MSAAKNNTATATTATAEGACLSAASAPRGYIGRFAPSPTGDLHLGSLFTAVASYLDARTHRGQWLLRVEDLDRPREVPGATARILDTLAAFGFEWPEPVLYQSARIEIYQDVINDLDKKNLIYRCRCSRRDLIDEERYPGTCRERHWDSGPPAALRLRVEPGTVEFTDAIQGRFRQDVALAIGDFIVQRRDKIIAYCLAVVIDDAAQGVTHVVRGADLLDNTPRQIHLQRILGLPTPQYAHVPVLVEADGAKLAKSRRSIAVQAHGAARQLCEVFALLGLGPPAALRTANVAEAWSWALERWDSRRLARHLSIALAGLPDLP